MELFTLMEWLTFGVQLLFFILIFYLYLMMNKLHNSAITFTTHHSYDIRKVSEEVKNTNDEIKDMKNQILFHFKDLRDNIIQIQSKLDYMSAETIICNSMPTDQKRSEAAKKAWEKRKQKQITKGEK